MPVSSEMISSDTTLTSRKRITDAEHAMRIRAAVATLNAAINDAAADGISTRFGICRTPRRYMVQKVAIGRDADLECCYAGEWL